MSPIKKILIRLPNWLGDMVMATAFVQAVQQQYPQAQIDFIAKKGIDFLLDYFPTKGHKYIFSKDDYKGFAGLIQFGKQIKQQQQYDLFFCLPNSFSAAIMGYCTGATQRVGFKKSIHSLFFTKTILPKKNIHRVDEYVHLINTFTKTTAQNVTVTLQATATQPNNTIIININSEASSRRLPVQKAVSIINHISSQLQLPILLIGSPKEKFFVDEVYKQLSHKSNIQNIAGTTNLPQLITLMANCKAVLSTDNGPAHISNALSKNTVVLFGAGNEHNTAPYNKSYNSIVRLGQLACEPCTKNICKLYNEPKCLTLLNEVMITQAVKKAIL